MTNEHAVCLQDNTQGKANTTLTPFRLLLKTLKTNDASNNPSSQGSLHRQQNKQEKENLEFGESSWSKEFVFKCLAT